MRIAFGGFLAALALLAGCTEAVQKPDGASDGPAAREATPAATAVASSESSTAAAASEASSQPVAVPIDAGAVTLTPENTKIEFVGLHLPPKQPDPRTGGFEKFTGKIQVDPATKALKSITVDIDTTSIWTQIDRLTEHLKSPDFFEVREYPTAKFESTKVEPAAGDAGQNVVTGKLTLHGVTKEISFPATVTVSDAGLMLKSQFTIVRTDFDIKYRPDQVDKTVTLNVVVGEKTQPRQAGGGGGKGGRKGSFDPAQAFARQDANSDGKLTGDEISEKMRPNVGEIDTDKDGSISLAEYQERMRQFGGRGGKTPGGEKSPDSGK